MRLGVGVDQRHLDAERLQLLLDGDRGVLVVLRGVESDLHLQRLVRAVAQFGQHLLGLVLTVELRLLGIVRGARRVAGDAGRHEGIGRDHRVLPDLLRQVVAVDGHGHGVTKLHVVPRRLVGLEGVVIGAEIGPDPHLVAELGLDVGQLLGGQVVVRVELARLEALHRGGAILGGNEVDDVDLHVGRIVELVVLHRLDVIVRHELGQHIGAVGDQVAGLDEVGAQLVDARLVHRIGGLVGEHLEEIGGGRVERHLEGAGVHLLDAKFVRLLLARGDVLGIHHRRQHVGIFGGGCGIDQAAPGIDEVICRHRRAVGPQRALTELEGVGLAIGRNGVALGSTRLHRGLGVLDHQAHEQVTQDVGLVDGRGLVRVKRLRVGGVAPVVDHLGECAGGRHREHAAPDEPGFDTELRFHDLLPDFLP